MMMPAGSNYGARKQACELCRQRKRRCDGDLPACSTCRKAHTRCVYALNSIYGHDGNGVRGASMGIEYHDASDNIMDTTGLPPNPFAWDPYAATSLPSAPPPLVKTNNLSMMGTSAALDWLDSNTTSSDHDPFNFVFDDPSEVTSMPYSGPFSDTVHSRVVSDTDGSEGHTRPSPPSRDSERSALPSQQHAIELAKVFFGAQHRLLPCIHKSSFLAKLRRDIRLVSSSPLLWVMLALASSCDQRAEVQAMYQTWMRTAKQMLDDMTSAPVSADCTSMLQASVWLVFESYSRGHLTEAWLLLGRMCQLSSALGFNRIDCDRPPKQMIARLRECTTIEAEERRMSLWALFLLDRIIGSINDLPLSFDEQQFKVDFPLADEQFQQFNNSSSAGVREPFSVDAYDLLNSNATSEMVSRPCFNHVLKASVILGRTMNIQNRLHLDVASGTKMVEEVQQLHTILQTFCTATSRPNNSSEAPTLVVTWLVLLLQYSRLLMLHPPGPEVEGQCACGIGVPSHREPECKQAVEIIIKTFQRALDEGSGSQSLRNPFLLPIVCACVRVLAKDQLRLQDSGAMRSLLDTVDRIETVFPQVAIRCREAIQQRLENIDQSALAGDVFFVNFDCY